MPMPDVPKGFEVCPLGSALPGRVRVTEAVDDLCHRAQSPDRRTPMDPSDADKWRRGMIAELGGIEEEFRVVGCCICGASMLRSESVVRTRRGIAHAEHVDEIARLAAMCESPEEIAADDAAFSAVVRARVVRVIGRDLNDGEVIAGPFGVPRDHPFAGMVAAPHFAGIRARLGELEADERLSKYPRASIFANSVLAMEQIAMRTEACTIRTVLGMPLLRYHGED